MTARMMSSPSKESRYPLPEWKELPNGIRVSPEAYERMVKIRETPIEDDSDLIETLLPDLIH